MFGSLKKLFGGEEKEEKIIAAPVSGTAIPMGQVRIFVPQEKVDDYKSSWASYADQIYETGTAFFTLSYDANGGTGSVPASGEYAQGTEVSVKFDPLPSTEEKTFLGWAANKNAE